MVMPSLALASVSAAQAAWLNEWSATPVLLMIRQLEKEAAEPEVLAYGREGTAVPEAGGLG
jgi:hypothetical protein